MNAVMFDPQGRNIPAAILKKNILAQVFSSVTKVNMDMYEKSLKCFFDENKVEKENSCFHPHQTLRPMVKLTNVISWIDNYFVH
jgi:hypothetical protein